MASSPTTMITPSASSPRLVLLLLGLPTMLAAQSGVTLSGDHVRLEVRTINGQLQERYQAQSAGTQWITVAVNSGNTIGPVSVRAVALENGNLVERLAAGSHEIVRTIRPAGRRGWLRVDSRLTPASPTAELHSFADRYRFEGQPDWSYAPSVGGFNPDAQYKAPLILTQQGHKGFGIVPDVNALTREIVKRCQHSLDLDVPAGPLLLVGFIPSRMHFHSVYTEDLDRTWTASEPVVNSYYLLITADAPPGEAFREAVRWHWEQFGRPAQRASATGQTGTDAAYRSLALWDDWRTQVWDKESRDRWVKVTLDGGATGGAVRTIRWGGPSPSVYMSAWFNSVRTAVGMGLYARRQNSQELLDLATGTIRLALAAPGPEGAFKCVALPKDDKVVWIAGDGSGASIKTGFLGFDMSWTAYWLLKWRAAGLPEGDSVLPKCRRLAKFLMGRQASDGMIPSRFDESGAVEPELSRMLMAETGPAALFLLELYRADRDPKVLEAALHALSFLEREVIPQRKWYDFETFFSCSPRALMLDARTAQWPANNLALIPTVEAFLVAHQVTRKPEFLAQGEALLDYLLLYQQSWTNLGLENLTGPTMLLGGFTTQNSDAEWSDARQSQAGNVLLDYFRATGKPEYLERGIAALRSQFPISPSENWAHVGYGRKAGVSSFHWGTGSGMAGIEMEEDFLRDVAVDVRSGRATGINGIDVTNCEIHGDRIQLSMSSPFTWPRKPVVTFHGAVLEKQYRVLVNGSDLGAFSGTRLKAGIPVPLR